MQGQQQDLKGCPGAVWSDGTPSPTYCEGKSWNGELIYPWWEECCFWNDDENTCKYLYNPRKVIKEFTKFFNCSIS